MKNLKYLLLSVSFVLLGCSSTYVLDKESPFESIERIHRGTKGKKGILVTKEAEKYNAKEINVRVDSTSWIDLNTNLFQTRANSDMHKIVITNPAKGAISGLGFGILAGFAVGAVLGAATYDGSDFLINSRGDAALFGGTFVGAVGGFLGLILGAMTGNDNTFIFHEIDLASKNRMLKGVQILNEDQKSIQIKWKAKILWLDKANISIIKKGDRTDIKISERALRKYHLIRIMRILSETESSIQIEWQDRKVWLNKKDVIMEKTDDGIEIRIPESIYKERFGK